jgi:hypothetical protein
MSSTTAFFAGSMTATEFGRTATALLLRECPNARAAATAIPPRIVAPTKRGHRRRSGSKEGRILAQNRLLKLLESRAGLETQLALQRNAAFAVDLERLGLLPAPVQRRHQLTAKTLPEGML